MHFELLLEKGGEAALLLGLQSIHNKTPLNLEIGKHRMCAFFSASFYVEVERKAFTWGQVSLTRVLATTLIYLSQLRSFQGFGYPGKACLKSTDVELLPFLSH